MRVERVKVFVIDLVADNVDVLVGVKILEDPRDLIIRVELVLLVEGIGHAHAGQVGNRVLHEDFEHVTTAACHNHAMGSKTNH